MRVSRVQAEENRQAVLNEASRLFRQHGFDGIGLKDLMASAGLTQGAFYKQFASKEDLAAKASGRAIERARRRWAAAAEASPADPMAAVVAFYLSMDHRAERMDGCPIVALGSDVARQGADVKASFEAGIRDYLEMACAWMGGEDGEADADASRPKVMAMLATMVGAMVLARAVNDDDLSKEFLEAAAGSVLAASAAERARRRPAQ
jgi:TetR/AcrR family transcriptional repressor of nem operon